MATEWPPVYDPSYLPHRASEHWDPRMETMDPGARDRVIVEKLGRQVRYAHAHSGFYKDLYRRAPVDPENLGSLDEFRRLPILTKEHIRVEQERHPVFGRFLCIPEERVFRVHGTSGTTGRPTVFGIGRDDWERIAEAHARVLWSVGLRPGDCIMVAAVFSLYIGSWGALVGAERLGARCFPFGAGAPGQTERAVEWATMLRPSALYATPSYALYLAETARRMGWDPRDLGFRVMCFSGEPGASVPATRHRIRETFGCQVIDQGTMAEMTPWMSSSGCRHLERGMHLWNDIVFTEMLDPETGEPVPPGGEGVPTYTHLERTSQPMIRYWSGDLARWDMVPCPCGRTYPTLTEGIYGRVDDMITVRGQNVFPSRIEDLLRRVPAFGGEFRLVLDRESSELDRLTVRVEIEEETYRRLAADSEEMDRQREVVAAELRRGLGIGTVVDLVPEGSFERTQFKSSRVIDSRGIWRTGG